MSNLDISRFFAKNQVDGEIDVSRFFTNKDISSRRREEVTEDRAIQNIDTARLYIAFWREYPDLFVDFLAGPDSTFKLYYYQRIFLRAAMRHRYVYFTFPRAYSKSFLSVLVQVIRCILYPGAKLFVTAEGKEQSAGILSEKMKELLDLIPALRKELAGEPNMSRDSVTITFKNGSVLDNMTASNATRGKRRHGGVVEECILIDGDILSEVIIPTMNVSRRCASGEIVDDEVLNKSQIYINFSSESYKRKMCA